MSIILISYQYVIYYNIELKKYLIMGCMVKCFYVISITNCFK
ncbi:hypothetical protein XSR1_30191 [Xenorhabdus szentirmaii DSM 16338]|uniref:Uncharacterized protein n=1 Tax=Xenorhabdus szentirmaii DSM 16338 TaxID=1427518 RepID=W1IZS5_9GAMM|nr:hypothetical protein XSR1_30191 [Xenorhabdus szentirmaii DSM 16338]